MYSKYFYKLKDYPIENYLKNKEDILNEWLDFKKITELTYLT